MDFVRSYFFTNEALSSWTLFSSKLDWRLSANLILMCSTAQRFIRKEVTYYKIHTLDSFLLSRRTIIRRFNEISTSTNLSTNHIIQDHTTVRPKETRWSRLEIYHRTVVRRWCNFRIDFNKLCYVYRCLSKHASSQGHNVPCLYWKSLRLTLVLSFL